jgi:hypothetical protein
MKVVMIFKLTLAVLLMTTTLGAQTRDKTEAKADTVKKEERTNTKILLDKIEITGKIEKPQTAFIIQGQEQSVEDIHIDRSFFREMFRKIEREDMKKLSERRRAKHKTRK